MSQIHDLWDDSWHEIKECIWYLIDGESRPPLRKGVFRPPCHCSQLEQWDFPKHTDRGVTWVLLSVSHLKRSAGLWGQLSNNGTSANLPSPAWNNFLLLNRGLMDYLQGLPRPGHRACPGCLGLPVMGTFLRVCLPWVNLTSFPLPKDIFAESNLQHLGCKLGWEN